MSHFERSLPVFNFGTPRRQIYCPPSRRSLFDQLEPRREVRTARPRKRLGEGCQLKGSHVSLQKSCSPLLSPRAVTFCWPPPVRRQQLEHVKTSREVWLEGKPRTEPKCGTFSSTSACESFDLLLVTLDDGERGGGGGRGSEGRRSSPRMSSRPAARRGLSRWAGCSCLRF